MRAPDLRRPALRLGAMRLVLCLGLLSVAARAAHLALFDHRGAEHGEKQVLTEMKLPPERGEILDRRGQQLAVTVKAPSVFARPGLLADPAAAASSIAPILGADPAHVAQRLASGSSYRYVARWVSPEQAEKVRALHLKGVGVVDEARRVYPYGPFAANAIGFANIDGTGVRGIEEQEDDFLRGTARTLPAERDALGKRLLSEDIDPNATAGGDVTLTIDAAFQSDAEAALDEGMNATGAESGLVVSLDPRNGEILSLVERPYFDPNRFRDTPYKTTRARAFLDAYEPGSTFKVFLMAAALESGAVGLHDRFDCGHGRFQVPGKLIRDSHPYGILDLAHVLWKSSNIGATKIAYRLGPDTHWQMLQNLGFGKPTGSGFPQESSGLLRNWRHWRRVDRANIAFGQGVNVTALQLAAATAAVANGGIWVQPRLVLGHRAPGGSFEVAPPGRSHRAMSPQTAATVLSLMEGVTGPEGTGKRAALPGIRVGGKTGTAQKLDPRTGTYSEHKYLAWFIGVAPVDDPRLVVVVMIDEPKGLAHTGGAVAAPIFARVAAAQLARLGIFTAGPEVKAVQNVPTPHVAPVDGALAVAAAEASDRVERLGDRVLVPDFTDRTVEEVRRQATGVLEVVVHGEGRAVAQEPPPGTIVDGETRVRVRFARGPGEG